MAARRWPAAANHPSFPPLLCLLSVLLSSSLLPRSTSQTTSQEDEKRILLEIKANWENPTVLSSWNDSDHHYCNWFGIVCTNGFVAQISLRKQGIRGVVPPAICDLKNLSHLDLYYNYLSGTFPTTLYNCSNLKYLDISQNLFVGEIPADIYRMPSRLTYLDLSSNNFTGNVPLSIGRLPAIQSLSLSYNFFNGSFPIELGNLSTLRYLGLDYNPFTPARIPPEFGNLTKLTYLSLGKIKLFGEIPKSLENLVELELLDWSWNSLNGTIPDWIWKLEKLKYLYLWDNEFSGEIKGTIGALGLVELDVSMNQLTGSIPEDIGKLKNLSILFMYYNRLSGEIPASIGLLPNLYDIRLFSNNLTGALPPELGKHSKLSNLEVQWNNIFGKLPEYLCAGKALTSLNVFLNNFTGEVPASLGDCSTLNNIQLFKNAFSGDFPYGIWSAVNLTTVIIHHNALSGTLPDELPWNLTRLEMENNRFSGKIPSSAKNLTVFIASNNLFSGEIPKILAGVSRLSTLSLGGNQISGSIPPAVSALTFLAVLDLSHNQLSGEIPAALGSLPVLTSLDLSDNRLSGEIPQAIGNLKLSHFNLSSNQLSGEIPTSLQNQADELSFLANPSLCSSSNSIKNLRTCGHRSNGSETLSKGVLILLLTAILGVVFLLATIVIGTLMLRGYRRRKMDGVDLASWKLTSFHAVDFTERSIISGLTECNLIGSGGSGKVYRIILGDRAGEIVAVKKIWNDRKLDSILEKEFQAEVEILGSIRHANIVKLLCCISNGNSKLLVYEYMNNRSLDQWLHKSHGVDGGLEHSNPLDWPTRLGIAIGAARGLAYMHHDCCPPIMHRDVKSSNILLDADFCAKIADFGLARMLMKAGEPKSVSALAGSFGYMAPECGYLRKVTEKVDVFSFGVVLLELVTGRRANDEGEHECLADWARRHYQDGRVVDFIDAEIPDPLLYLDEMDVVFRLGLFCTENVPLSRPSMKEVLQVLIKCDQRLELRNLLPGEFGVPPLLQTKRDSRRKSLSNAREEQEHDSLAGLV